MYVLALLLVACGEAPSTGEQVEQKTQGVLELPLSSTSMDGHTYRLVGATFSITGPQAATVTDTSADTVSVPLPAGRYSVELGGEWRIERADAPGQAVQASLISPNPLPFAVSEGQTRTVRFLFKVPGEGNADVGITVDSGGWVAGTLQFGTLPPGSPATFAELSGRSVPFVISFSSSTLTRRPPQFDKELFVETGPISIQFGGAPSALLQDRIAPALEGQPLSFALAATGSGQVYFSGFTLEAQGTPLSLEVTSAPVSQAGVDRDGYPLVQPVQFEASSYLNANDPDTGVMSGVAATMSATLSPQ